jgi:hypothetical protein
MDKKAYPDGQKSVPRWTKKRTQMDKKAHPDFRNYCPKNGAFYREAVPRRDRKAYPCRSFFFRTGFSVKMNAVSSINRGLQRMCVTICRLKKEGSAVPLNGSGQPLFLYLVFFFLFAVDFSPLLSTISRSSFPSL